MTGLASCVICWARVAPPAVSGRQAWYVSRGQIRADDRFAKRIRPGADTSLRR